jgi:lipase maturation factor
MVEAAPDYWLSRFVFERALAAVYLIAFLNAVNQFLPLLGERGLLPVSRYVRLVSFRATPSLFFLAPRDVAFRSAAWTGVALSALALSGYPQQLGTAWSAAAWASLWILYLSFVNVGQTFYAFGWESLLLETGFLAIFAGGGMTTPNALLIWMWRWVLFRDMFGAGLIKLRGDSCWHDLTCLHYYFETQPMPNALSWHFHQLPSMVKRAGVALNHVVELALPFLYFAPQPFAAVGGLLTIAFQLVLIVSGNLSWLNWLTIVLCIPTLDDRWWSWLPVTPPVADTPAPAHRVIVAALAVVVLALSVRPVRNMWSRRQLMNYSFNPLHVVNTYGAFGSITRIRHEIVIEGTDEATVTPHTRWRAYEFKGKPGDPTHRPPQVAPYHLRLDWLMWFAAMTPPSRQPWFVALLIKLLSADPAILRLLRTNPFPDAPPRWVRAMLYEYHFSGAAERRATGRWWTRREIGPYLPASRLHAADDRTAVPNRSSDRMVRAQP